MSVSREDLVGFALGALDVGETERIRTAAAANPGLAAQLKTIESHLAVHDRVPKLNARPELWFQLRERLDEAPAKPSILRRFALPIAAAALIALALVWPPPQTPELRRLHGQVTQTRTNTYTCDTVSRVELGTGVTLTLDTGTTFELLDSNRLALRAGRVFFEVTPDRRGFTVEAGDLTATTTGTAFLVSRDPALVWTESGKVRCTFGARTELVGPGQTFQAASPTPTVLAGSPRDWFRRPSLTARILDAMTIRVVIRNDMPDSIHVTPLAGGEPLFFASFDGHDYPLAADDFAAVELAPSTDTSFLLRLPQAVPQGEKLILSYPTAGVRVEASR